MYVSAEYWVQSADEICPLLLKIEVYDVFMILYHLNAISYSILRRGVLASTPPDIAFSIAMK